MKKIGNILYTNKIKVDECFNKCSKIEEIDQNIPTLIVGLDNAKKYIENFNITVKYDKLKKYWWTFSKKERLFDFEKDMKLFYQHCIENINNNIIYYNINILNLNYNKIKKLINYILNTNDKKIYVENNRFVFIYDMVTLRIYGLSLTTCRYCGVNDNKVLDIIFSNTKNKRIYDFSRIPLNIRKNISNNILLQIVMCDYF